MRAIKTTGACLCLLAGLIAVFEQFKVSSLWPLVFAALCIMPIRWLRPGWFRAAWIIPICGFLLLMVDAYALRHRIAVQARVWYPVWGGHVAETFVSPSGRTSVYLVALDGAECWSYCVYVSESGWFPLFGEVHSNSPEIHRRNLTMGWRGTWFAIGDGLISYAYSEADHRAYSYDEWIRRPRAPDDTYRTLEGFSAYVSALQPKD